MGNFTSATLSGVTRRPCRNYVDLRNWNFTSGNNKQYKTVREHDVIWTCKKWSQKKKDHAPLGQTRATVIT